MRDPFLLRMAPGDGAKLLAACEAAAQREQATQATAVTPTGLTYDEKQRVELHPDYPGGFLPPWTPSPTIADGVEYEKPPPAPGSVNRDEPGWRRIGRAR